MEAIKLFDGESDDPPIILDDLIKAEQISCQTFSIAAGQDFCCRPHLLESLEKERESLGDREPCEGIAKVAPSKDSSRLLRSSSLLLGGSKGSLPASGGSKRSWVLCLLQEEAKGVKVLCLTLVGEKSFVRASLLYCGSKRRVTILYLAQYLEGRLRATKINFEYFKRRIAKLGHPSDIATEAHGVMKMGGRALEPARMRNHHRGIAGARRPNREGSQGSHGSLLRKRSRYAM
ncbi:hypothetical protein M5K25_016448 [Dendrobium thyrsiflorum]|uniref:Uncharacterized protein n=1 Tax=Dendrobium thyrsiflorum TaxID=117978 RepID=A0ABD0UJQ6_DENTH